MCWKLIHCHPHPHFLPQAQEHNQVEVVTYLKSMGASVANGTDGPELCKLAHAGDKAGIDAKVENQVDINTADYDGRTAMHLAAASGNIALVQHLLSLNGAVDSKDRWGGTPLEDSIRQGHDGTTQLLIALGASTASPDTANIKISVGEGALVI